MIKVSVCIPCYQQTEYLEKCLDSVLAQDLAGVEIIVTDDTPDDTVKDFIAARYPVNKINYFKNPVSLGTPENWNEAVRKASGEYIKILHHDDHFTRKTSLSQFVALLENDRKADFAFSATEVWNVPTGRRYIHACSDPQLRRIQQDPSFLFFRNMIGSPSATIYRRSIGLQFEKNLKWLVDIDFYIRAIKKNPSISRSTEALVCTADNTSGQVTQSVLKDRDLQVREHILELQKIGIGHKEKMILFLDELFTRTEVRTMEELKKICAIPADLEDLFKAVFDQMGKRTTYKKWRNWFYGSRLNNKLFRLEKY